MIRIGGVLLLFCLSGVLLGQVSRRAFVRKIADFFDKLLGPLALRAHPLFGGMSSAIRDAVDMARVLETVVGARDPEHELRELVRRTDKADARRWRTPTMRVERAIDAFLDWRKVERDATPRSLDSYRRILWKLAEVEDLIEHDPSRKIRRPPKRKPDVYRPSAYELTQLRHSALPYERAAILLMDGAGLRRSEVVGCKWSDVDLKRNRVRVQRRGGHWQTVPLDPDVADELKAIWIALQPDGDDHVFTVEVEQWVSQ